MFGKRTREYADCGFMDFEALAEFSEELSFDELLSVNGGCGGGCGGGGGSGNGYTPSYTPNPNPPSKPTKSSPSTTSTSSGCGGTPKTNTLPSTILSGCSGAPNLPPKQTCTNPEDYHCDIYAWNFAVDNSLDPRKGKNFEIDLNNQTVDTMYESYYKGKEAAFNSTSAGKKGMLVYDWGGTSSAKDHSS